MSYKSYAQTGQFGTYKIDLPIKTEINEDLRAASDFAKQMERSQKYREKWAHSYLTALQAKSSIERQNRDDNFEFLQKNFKAIYEGEQRQFDGEIAKLRREQAEAAGAEPGFLEKVLPGLLKLVPSAINIIGNINAAELQATNKWSQEITDQLQQGGVTFTVPELESMRNIAAKSPELAEQMFKARAEGTGVGWQDLQRYTTLNGEALAFRNMNTGLTQLGKVEHLLRQEQLPGRSLDPASFAGNNIEYYQAYNKAIADAKQHIYGGYELNDATRAQINKWEGGIRNDFERKAFNTWEGQAKVQYEQQEQNKVNFLVSGEPSEVGNGLYEMQRTRKSYYEGRGFTPKEAHEAAFTDTINLLTGENSLATVEDFDLFMDTFHRKRNEHIISQGGAPIEKGKGWTYETAAVARRKMVEKSFKLTTHGTKQRLNDEAAKKNEILAQINSYEPGSANQRNFITQVQQEYKGGASPTFERWIKSLGHNSVVPQRPNFEQQTGMTHASLIKTAERMVLSKLKGAGSAYNNDQSDAYLKGLQSTQSAVFEIVGNTKVNFNKYAGEFPNITNPEALRHEILTRSYQDLMDKGEIGLENVNADGTAKVPAEAVTFRRIGGENPTGMTVQGFEDKAKQEGDKFLNTFTPLTPNDRGVYDRYAEIRGSMPEGADPDHHDMQLMANNPRMISLRKVFKNKSIYELMDLDLKALGYEGLRNIPLKQADINKNRGIARRMLMGGKILTGPGVQFATNGGKYTLSPYGLSTSFPVTSTFKEPRGGGREHAGSDLGTPQGTPILAKTGGVVIDSGFTGTGAGGEIFIDNGNGYDSRHLHMNRIVVQPGQRIEPGQLLGYTGGAVGTKGAGHSTGPHLHTEIRLNGQLLDPLSKDSNGTLLDQFFGYGVN